MSYLKCMMKTFEPLTKKTTKKKKRERRDRERNRRDRQKEGFEKVRSDSYMFLKNEIQSFERNWVGIEFHMKTCLIDRKESSRNQRNPKLLVKTYFSSSHFDRSKSKGQKFLKILEKKKFVKSFENCFYDMTCMFMTSNDFQNQTLSNFLNLFFLHSQKCIKHIKKFNFGRPQNLTHNHMYQI